MKRIRADSELTKKGWGVLRENRQLIRFPIYGTAATIPLAIITLGPGLHLIEVGQVTPGAPIAVLGLFILAFVGIYFSVCPGRVGFPPLPRGQGEAEYGGSPGRANRP